MDGILLDVFGEASSKKEVFGSSRQIKQDARYCSQVSPQNLG